MSATSYISVRRLAYWWEKAKAYISDMISNAISPTSDKEVISVLTYSDSAPSSPEENDYYINSEENKLYKYIEDAWVEQDASADCVYIAEDTARVYVYQNSRFSEASGGVVDGIIYMKSINDVEKINDLHTGVYTAKVGKKAKTIYTLIVKENYATYQTLYNHWGFYSRTEDPATREWSDWNEHDYAIIGLIRDNFLVKYDSDTEKLVDAGINANNVASKTDLNAKADKPILTASSNYTVKIGKIYNLGTINNVTISLDETDKITSECPQWHFFFTKGTTSNDSPTFNQNIIWDSIPTFTGGKTYEVDIIGVSNGSTTKYYGLCNEKEDE